MSSNWGYLTMKFLHANLMYRILLPVHHLNVNLYANFVHAVHEQANDNLYHHRAPWWHCVPLMQLLEQRTRLQCVPLMSSMGRYSGFLWVSSSKLWLDTRAESSHLFLLFLITSQRSCNNCVHFDILTNGPHLCTTGTFMVLGRAFFVLDKLCGHLCKVPVIETARSIKILPTGNIMKLNNCWASILACQWELIIVEPLLICVLMEMLTSCKDTHIHQ